MGGESSSTSKFGKYSYKNGSITLQNFDIQEFLNTKEWTIEFWVYYINQVYYALLQAPLLQYLPYYQGNYNLFILSSNGRDWTLFYPNYTSAAGILSLNEWHHIAIVRKDEECKRFHDGKLVLTQNFNNATIQCGNPFSISANSCYLDDFRISDKAIYVSNFTPKQYFLKNIIYSDLKFK